MSGKQATPAADRLISTGEVGGRERYQLLTSLVVPRPIGWLSSRSAAGVPNLAPFSYFVAISSSPMLVGLSIGSRRGKPKDSLANVRETGVFCLNVVTERHLRAMNESSAEHPPEIDEFEAAGLHMAEAETVEAPYVADCPAVLECRQYREIDLPGGHNSFLIGEVVAVRLSGELPFLPGTHLVDPQALRPVGRLGGEFYGLLTEIPALSRPALDD